MANLIRKYGLWILTVAIVSVLVLVYIPYKERFYLDKDREDIESLSEKVLIWTEVFLLVSLLVYWIIRRMQIDRLVIGFFGVALSGVCIFFLLSPFFMSALYCINDISFNKSLSKKYKVIDADFTSHSLYIYNAESKQSFRVNSVLKTDMNAMPKENQEIELVFNKGLLGYNKIQSLAVK